MPEILEPERRTYDLARLDLLEKFAGKFVLVHGDKVVDVFETEMDAVKAGYTRFGLSPFMVRQVQAVERVYEHAADVLLLP